MIETNDNNLVYSSIDLMKQLFPEGEASGTISKNRQTAILEKFEGMVDFHTFSFVIDVSTQSVTHNIGIKRHLFYNTFDITTYFNSIPTPLLRMMNELARVTFQLANSDATLSQFMGTGLTIDLPIRRADGKYLLTQRTLYVFDICPKGRVKSYLNFYVILKELDSLDLNFSLSPRVKSNKPLQQIEKLEKLLAEAIQEGFKIDFTRAEKEVLHEVKLKKNNKEIAIELGITENTVKTLKSRALKRAKKFFGEIEISNTDDLVLFLEENKIKFE